MKATVHACLYAILSSFTLSTDCLAAHNPPTNYVCTYVAQTVDIHSNAPAIGAVVLAGGPYALPAGGNLQITVSGCASVITNGQHVKVTTFLPCPLCGSTKEPYSSPYDVTPEVYASDWTFSPAGAGTGGQSFSGTNSVSAPGVYTLTANFKGTRPCGLCECTAGASTNCTVYRLTLTPSRLWLGLDRRDGGTSVYGTGTSALVPADPWTNAWTHTGVCMLSNMVGNTAQYWTTGKESCSAGYLDQKLEVTAHITSPQPFSLSATTNFTVVRVDVAIAGTSEETEETEGAKVLFYADNPDGTLSSLAQADMAGVSITCTPSNLPYGERVTVEAPADCLYVRDGTNYVAAAGSYEASEIGSKEFFLHGHDVTAFEILVTHPASQAKDKAKVTVFDNPLGKNECEACAKCVLGSQIANKSIYFAQDFGRTPWVAGAPSGLFRVHEKVSTDRLGRLAMFKYDHPMNRRIVSRHDATGYVEILDSQDLRVSYRNGKPADESSGQDMQCVIGADGLVTEILPDRTRVVYGADNAVLKLVTPGGVEVPAADLGIKVVRTGGGIRQVWSKTDGLLDAVQSPYAPETVVSWYAPSAVSQQPDASGLYTFTGNPAKTFTFHQTAQAYYRWVSGPKCPVCEANGGHEAYDYVICGSTYALSGVNYGLTLDERRGTEFLFQYEWKFDRYDNDWTFTKGSGNDFVKDRLIHIRAPGASTVTRVRSDASGRIAFHDRKVYLNDRYGARLVRRSSVAADGAERLSYSADPITNAVLAGRMASDVNEYGNATSYGHDAYGRVTSESTSIAGGIAQVTSYGYSDAPDAQGFIDRRPSSVTVTQDGVTTSSTQYSYKAPFAVSGSGSLGLCDTVTRTDPKTGVTLKSYTHYYSVTSDNLIGRGRVRLTVNPDGTAAHYAYAGDDNSWTETVTQGYFDASVAGVTNLDQLFSALPGKSARTVNTHDFKGDIVLTENYVHTGSAFTLAGWTTNSYNIMHKQLGSARHDGTSEMSNWICTGPVWQRNADGTTVTNTFDTAKRIKTSTHYTPFGNVTKAYTYDADNRVVSQTTATNGVLVGCGGSGCGATYTEYDTEGRAVLSVDTQGRTNRTSYSADNLVVTRIDPAGAIVVEINGTDGSLLCRTGSVMRTEYYTHGVDAASGTRWEQTAYGSPAGVDYTKSYYNALGQLVLQERPGFGGAVLKTVYAYNTKGQLESETRLVQGGTGTYDLPVTTYAYNQLGDRSSTTQTVASVSRIQTSDSAFVLEDNVVRQVTTSIQSCSDVTIPAITNATITRLYPLGTDGLLAESRSRDVRGNETVQKVVQNSTTYERTTTVSNATSVLPAISISLAGLTLSSTDQHGCTTIYGYDVLMRQISAETLSGNANERLTGSYTHYNALGQVDYTEDALGTRTVYGYEPATGRRISTTQIGKPTDPVLTTYTAYDTANRTIATWGATYPVAYEYDQVGRMIAMYTYRGTAAISSYSDIAALKPQMDRTQWFYDQATGLLTNKLYADGKGPSYSYTALGQLSTRAWARPSSTGQQLLTQYGYDNFGSLTNTAYSDGTPSISFIFNALGQMKTVTDASGTRTLDYAADGQMIAEAIAFNTSLFTLHEKSDIFGRNQGYALSNEVALITGTMQSYDMFGRLSQVAVDGISAAFSYGYLEGSHRQKTLAMPNGVTRTFGYEPNRDLLTMIVHSNASERLVQRDFTFDGLGRLENRTLFRASETPANPDSFGYNLRSELTNAVIGANAFAYNFDPIGNRNSATEFGTNTSYTASALNQYTSISNSVNSVPLCEINPEFDLDGNQTLLKTITGIWHVTYNAENRPICFSNETTKVEMAYDYMGRRFEYKETVSCTLTRHERYLYRGYLQLVALDMLSNASVKHSIAWDPTEPTATRPLALQIGADAYFYSFDQVKNVTELFDSAGALATTYDYSPFGQVTSFQITQSGNNALTQFSNPLTFSSEVHDSALGLQYYNYRHLNLLDGRWVNRDPAEKDNELYLFVRNKAPVEIDGLGLLGITVNYEYDVSETDFSDKYVQGDTFASQWEFLYTEKSCGNWFCPKKEFVNYSAEVKIQVRIKKGFNTTANVQHENVHVAIHSSWARKLDNYYKPFMDVCMCPDYAKAVGGLLKAVKRYYFYRRFYEQYDFDCAVYPAGDGKKQVCNQRDAALESAKSIYAQEVVPAQEKVTACNK